MGGIVFQLGVIDSLRAAVVVLALGAVVGCEGAARDRTAVSGIITLDGQPLTTGQIVFEPRAQGRMTIAQLVDGRYSFDAERGPTSGEYIVRITASRTTGEKASGGPTSGGRLRDVYAQFLPAKYNDASELIVQIDTTQGDVEQNFELQSR